MFGKKAQMPAPEAALPGRDDPLRTGERHYVNDNPMQPPFPEVMRTALFGMGCFWGAEKKFWSLDGVFTTAVGYASGYTKNPSYEEVCSGMTGHNEVVLVAWNPRIIRFEQLLGVFWESHDPTQGMRQGNDVGTQYRSGVYCSDGAQLRQADASKHQYQRRLSAAGYAEITTEVLEKPVFYYAEEYHQQYLAKNPRGYCGLGGTGVSYPRA